MFFSFLVFALKWAYIRCQKFVSLENRNHIIVLVVVVAWHYCSWWWRANFQAFWNSEHGHFRGQSNYGNVVTASALPSSQVDKVSLMEPVSSLLYSKRCWASSSRVRCAVVEAVVAAVCTSLLARNGMTSFWQYCQELLLLYTIPKKWLYYGWPK